MTSVNDSLMYQGNCNVPTWGRDTSGNVTGLVGPDGNLWDGDVYSKPLYVACWGQERASGADTTAPEVIGAARFTDSRSPYWFCAHRGDAVLVYDFGIQDGGTGIKAVDWNSTSRSQGKTITELARRAKGIDVVLFNYGGADIVVGNGTTPTAATVFGYLQANIMAIMRMGLPVIVESIYPYLDAGTYRGVVSGWTAQGSGTAAQKQAIADAVNALLAAWCAKFPKQLLFVDLTDALKDGGSYASKKYMVDGIELNLKGSQLVGQLVAEASKNFIPVRRMHYFKASKGMTPQGIHLVDGFTNYYGTAGTNGTISWGTPSIGYDATHGPYFEVTATCSAITGHSVKNITNVTWDNGYLRFTVASHAMMPGQVIGGITGLSGSIAGALTGPYTVSSNDSETVFSVPLDNDPGTITIAGTPPSASATISEFEAYAYMAIFTEHIKANGTPATGITLSAGDMLQGSCLVYADDGAGDAPPLSSVTIRQRVYYAAGTPSSVYSDGGIYQPTSGNPRMESAFGPVRMVTPPAVSSNTTGGGSTNVSNSSAPQLQIGVVFCETGAARLRVYSPSIQVLNPGPDTITTPASGSAYTNKLPYPVQIVMAPNGATVTGAVVSRGDANATYSLGTGFYTGGSVVLAQNDTLTLTYSVATPILTRFVINA